MMEEAAYRGRELTQVTPAMAQHWLSRNELRYATLKAGRVVKVEKLNGIFYCRILVDYGEEHRAEVCIHYIFAPWCAG